MATKKEKEIELMMPLITGKEVYVEASSVHNYEGTVEKFTGLYLILKNGFFGDDYFESKMICSKRIISIKLKTKTNAN